MIKSLILTFVFAAISFAGAFAQTISRPAEAPKPNQAQKTEKTTPTDARPGAEVPTTRPSGKPEVENGEKAKPGKKGKHKGHHKPRKGKGKAKGHKDGQHDHDADGDHEGHNHGKGGESHGRRTEDNTKNSKPPVEAPSGRTPKKQGEKN